MSTRADYAEMEVMKLPEEIMMEILVTFPVKQLVRLSCVCKEWRNLIIKNPYFGDKHLNHWKNLRSDDDETVVFHRLHHRSNNVEDLIVNGHDLPLLVSQRLNLPDELRHGDIILACNGILCFAEALTTRSVHLYNPTTLEHWILPPGLREDCVIYPAESHGFGFDQSTNDYKVIRIKSAFKRWRIDMYKVSTNCWSKLDSELTNADSINGIGVYSQGFFHWLIENKSDIGHQRILTFDFKSEKFSEMECPKSPSPHFFRRLAVLDDSLAICSQVKYTNRIEVWVMGEHWNKEYWTKNFCVLFPFPWWENFMSPNCWIHGRNVVLLGSKQLLVCPLQEGPWQKAETSEFKLDCTGLEASIAFRRTLVSLRNRCDHAKH